MEYFKPTQTYTYNDIGLVPNKLSTVNSRNDIDTSTEFLGLKLLLPDDDGYKMFTGQASAAIKGHNNFIEGAELKIPFKGPVENIWKQYEDGLRSAMAYMNCHNLDEFRYLNDNQFCLWSDAVKLERLPHAGK